MDNLIAVKGIVLSVSNIGEYDRRVVILTKELGKIACFAKSARRAKSPLVAACNPFVFGEFSIYRGQSSYSISSVNVIDYFSELKADLSAVYYGFYFLEIADYYTRENIDDVDMLNLLYITLKALSKSKTDIKLIRRVFELKALQINGEYPNVFSCVSCGSKENLSVLSIAKQGVLCSECAGICNDGREINSSVLYGMQFVISQPINKIYNFALKDSVFEQFDATVSDLFRHFVSYDFKSLEMLDLV